MSYPGTLYRYTELKWATQFVEEGRISFCPAAAYGDCKLSEAQQDNEQKRQLNLKTPKYGIAVADHVGAGAHALQNLFKIGIEYGIVSGNEYLRYHILCLSYKPSPRFYTDFPEADCMITIHNPEEFGHRLGKALLEQMPEYGGQASSVFYYDPTEIFVPKDNLELCFCKNKAVYDWQTEYRIALFGPLEKATGDRIPLVLGDLKDICSITPKP